MARPEDQWWVINGAALMGALRRAHDGDDPDIAYVELIANSQRGDRSDG